MSVIAEIMASIAMMIIDIMVHLLATIFASTWFAAHSKGVTRAVNALSAILALHLLCALVFTISEPLRPFLLQPIFSSPVLFGSFVLFLLSLFFPLAVDLAEARANDRSGHGGKTKSDESVAVPMLFSYVLAFSLVIGTLTIWSSHTTRKSLVDRICASFESRIDETWKERGTRALEWLENKKGSDLPKELFCPD